MKLALVSWRHRAKEKTFLLQKDVFHSVSYFVFIMSTISLKVVKRIECC